VQQICTSATGGYKPSMRAGAIVRRCGACEHLRFLLHKSWQEIIMLHSFVKKSQKTPMKEIKIAKTRMSEVTENETF
jgi:phage-related protein